MLSTSTGFPSVKIHTQDSTFVPSCVYVHLGPTATHDVNARRDKINNIFFIISLIMGWIFTDGKPVDVDKMNCN